MSFNQQLNTIQSIIKAKNIYVPAIRKMGSCEVHDLYTTIDGVELYICVNYTTERVTWRNQDTGETVIK